MSFPNPWVAPELWQAVVIGGRPIKAALVAIDGNEIEDDWNVQKPTGNSGATNVFKGTKPPGPVTLTFEASDPDEFDDLRELFEMLAPKPGSGGNGSGATQGSPGSAAYGRKFMQATSPTSSAVNTSASAESLLAQAQASLAALQSGASATTTATTSSSSSTSTATPSPGPKPPTLSIRNGYLNYLGITAISRSKWKGPYPTETNSYRVDLTVVNQKEPTPAAVGAAAPKTPDNPATKSIPLGEIQDPAAAARDANAAAAKAGAIT